MATSKLSGHGAAARSKRAPPMLEVCRVGRHSGSKRREPRRRAGGDRSPAWKRWRRKIHAQQRLVANQPACGSVQCDGEDIRHASPVRVVELGLIQVPEGRRIFPTLTGTPEPRARQLSTQAIEARPQPRARQADFCAPRRALGAVCGFTLGWRTADARHRPRAYVGPEAAHSRRAILGLSPLLVETMFALIQRINKDGIAIFVGRAERGAVAGHQVRPPGG